MLTGVIYGPPLCSEGNYSLDHSNDLNEYENDDVVKVQWIAYRIIAPLLLTAGVFGNVLTLVALSSSSLRGVTYVYLTGLAIADTGVVIFWMPIAARLGYGVNGYYLSAIYQAHVELVAANTFMAASIFIMVCLTVDRYLSVFLPGRLRGGYIRRNSHAAIVVSFVVGFLVSVPLGAMRSAYEQQDGPDVIFTLRENKVITDTDLWRAYLWANEILVRFGPASLLFFLNGLIVKKFIQLTAKRRKFHAVSDKFRASHVAETSSLTRSRGYREEQHLVILVTAIVVLFFVATTPSACLLAWHARGRPEVDVVYKKFMAIANVAEMSNFALNFYVYLGCSTEFRAAVVKIFQGRCGEDSREPRETPVGEIEDFSRHGTTFRMSPEHTRLNSPGSPSPGVQNPPGESEGNKETHA